MAKPYRFRLGVDPVIRGLAEGVASMRVGGKRKLTIPPEMGYGQRGIVKASGDGYLVPPGASLVFEVELLEIGRPESPSETARDDGR